MPPVRTLLFLVPLVKALRPSTTPAKQLSTASSMKARVASQKAGHDRDEEHKRQTHGHTRQNGPPRLAHAQRCPLIWVYVNNFAFAADDSMPVLGNCIQISFLLLLLLLLHFWNQFPYFLLHLIVSPLTDSYGVSVAFVVDAEPPEPLVGGAARVPVLHPEVRCRGNDEKHQGSHAAEGAPSCQSVEHRGEAVGSSDLLSIQQLDGTQNGSKLH